MTHPINPPEYQSTEREDIYAAFRWWVDEYYNDLVFKLYQHDMKEYEKNFIEADKAISELEYFEKRLKAMKSDSHCGDCTAVAASCGRCIAEDFYNIKSTVTWNGKHEGWRLMYEYDKILEENKE